MRFFSRRISVYTKAVFVLGLYWLSSEYFSFSADLNDQVDYAPNYTTPAYQNAALQLLIAESDRAAHDLRLSENFPIAREKLTLFHITPYEYTRHDSHSVGSIQTTEYYYSAAKGFKLCYVTANRQEARCFEYGEKNRLPVSQLNTNAAFRAATNWLNGFKVDVPRLQRECELRISLENYFQPRGIRSKEFVPIYNVLWQKRSKKADERDTVALVRLFLPNKTLLSLRIEDARFNKRPPLTFTNLSELLAKSKNGSAIEKP